ncbi:MAG: response regulator [Kiritimatiellae bacterium]|nr:response regulator [Kiritimatiellia bacterium]
MKQPYAVLIADDSQTIRRVVKKYLRDTEFNVVAEAENGSQAVDLYKAHHPDLVVLDIIMPETDGIYALSKILQADPNAVVMMLSSQGKEEVILRALERGAKSYMQKPFDKDLLVAGLRRVVERTRDEGTRP